MSVPIRVLMIEERRLFSEALGALLEPYKEKYILVGSLTDITGILKQAQSSLINVVLINALLERSDAIEATQVTNELLPGVKIIVFGIDPADEAILNYIEAGAHGYLSKRASIGDLLRAIEAVCHDETPCSPRIAARVFARIAELLRERNQPEIFHKAALTQREKDILQLISEGFANKEIAQQLNISLPTVKNHVHNIIEKFQVRHRREAVQSAYACGILK